MCISMQRRWTRLCSRKSGCTLRRSSEWTNQESSSGRPWTPWQKDIAVAEATVRKIAPAEGKLGVLCVGLGAVATTFMAGVENVRRGAARPIGSLTQMGTIRLGKRTERRAPLIKEFVPLAGLGDLVFGAWDPVPDDAYAAAVNGAVLERHAHTEPIAACLKSIQRMRAV